MSSIPTILGLIFSKDRPMQLDACLASIVRHVPDFELIRWDVLYSASSPRLLGQYKELASAYDGKVRFTLQGRFRSDTLALLKSEDSSSSIGRRPSDGRTWWDALWPQKGRHANVEFVVFAVDDTLFVNTQCLVDACAGLAANPDALAFSLRLGRNTTESYVLSRGQALPAFVEAGTGILKYRWVPADGDFAYPLEISSSVYRLQDMQRLIARLSFSDPNTLESQMSLRAKDFARRYPFVLCTETSVAFSAPINRVQAVFDNRSGAAPDWSIDSLARKFEEGLRINVAALDGFVPKACHQEVELVFEPRPAGKSHG